MKFKSLFLIAPFFYSCGDVIEENISGKELIINSPANDLKTSNQELTFWWEIMEGARDYELQVVTPSFDSLKLVKLDTTQTKNKYLLTLTKGKYQWRIRATNAGYKSQFVYRSFLVQ